MAITGRQRQLSFIIGALLLLALTGAAAYFYTQGTLLPTTNCEWTHIPHPPGQDEHFDTVDDFVTAFAAANNDITVDQLRDQFEFEKRDGVIQYRSCGVPQ